jgi:phytoene synthase
MHPRSPEPHALQGARPLDPREDLAQCHAALRQGSRSFHAAALLLPREVREPASALYAFCRLADDVVDLAGGGSHAVEQLRERLDCAYAGRPAAFAADRSLADAVARFGIPRALLDALIEGFEWDAAGRRYESLDDLHAYAARVAGTVGAMMALLMGVDDREALARACELGIAMQLTNIARDVGEDARAGRLYLPLSWLREAGIDAEAWLAAPAFGPALAGVIRRLLDAADALYRRVDAGVARLRPSCRPGINAARTIYAEIGHELARAGYDSVNRRAVVPAGRKAVLLLRALTASAGTHGSGTAAVPVLGPAAFLVDAAAARTRTQPPAPEEAWWKFTTRYGKVIDLFQRLERRDQLRAFDAAP